MSRCLNPLERNELEKAMLGRGVDYETIQLILRDFDYRVEHLLNPKLKIKDLQQLKDRCIWWDNFGGIWCQCKNGYVVTENGTFSFDFVLSNGSAYLRKPDAII